MSSDTTNQHRQDTQPVLTGHLIVLSLAALITLFSRFFHPNLFGYFEDDFFYYAQVARNIAAHRGSTFDGVHLTNGYHPLWMLVILVLYEIFPGATFFIAVQVVSFIGILAFYFGIFRCLRYLHLPYHLIPLTALLLSLHALLLFRFGMEVTLALPFGIWAVASILNPAFRWTSQQTVAYGLLACAAVLSRLDGIFLVAALLAAQLFSSQSPANLPRPRSLLLFSLCFLPFLAYLLVNLRMFHTPVPVSGMAKQLKPLLPPSSTTLHSLVLPFDRTKAAFVYPALLTIFAGVISFRRSARDLPQHHRAILLALFVFPVLHLGSLSLLSDWTVWPWYFYSLIYAVLASAVVLLLPLRNLAPTKPRWRLSASTLTVLTGSYLIFLGAYSLFKKPAKTSQLAVFVADFSLKHPGLYAMGDDAGSTAFRSDQHFLQLEGLMMDTDYIHLLRERTPLREMLDRYHADYYVALVIERTGPCFITHEPAQAGAHSPRLPGRICAQPIAQDVQDGVSVGIFRASDVELP